MTGAWYEDISYHAIAWTPWIEAINDSHILSKCKPLFEYTRVWYRG